MTTQHHAEAQNNGKGFRPQPKDPVGQTSAQGSQAKPFSTVDSNIAGMRSMAHDALDGLREAGNQINDEYMLQAQEVADEFTQLMYDISSGRLIFDAVADNVAFLLEQHTKQVDRPSLGKHNLRRSSLKRLRPATAQDLSTRSLTAGE